MKNVFYQLKKGIIKNFVFFKYFTDDEKVYDVDWKEDLESED
jgi:hypothetical protein